VQFQKGYASINKAENSEYGSEQRVKHTEGSSSSTKGSLMSIKPDVFGKPSMDTTVTLTDIVVTPGDSEAVGDFTMLMLE
jgi:hypothetical protein